MAIWQPQGTRDVASLWPKRRHLARTLTGIARPSLAARGLLEALVLTIPSSVLASATEVIE
jgi:hypothetical protein